MSQQDELNNRLLRLTLNLRRLSTFTEQILAAAPAGSASVVKAQRVAPARRRGRAAVVCWDLSHNPVGRAFVLYRLLEQDWEVELIGPMWKRFGNRLWAPLADEALQVRSFTCETLADFVPQAVALVEGSHYDLVHVCKPRLPSLFIGALIKARCGCPLIQDVDDMELSFTTDRTPLAADALSTASAADLREPYADFGTRAADHLVAEADALTVSNVALRKHYGGQIIRHARDAQLFELSAVRRADVRQRLGIAPDELALVFVGTPRLHKGIVSVLRVLEAMNEPRICFVLVGDSRDKRVDQALAAFPSARLVRLPDCAFSELPDYISAADAVPLLQDVGHPIAQHQIPAKISDALALGVPVLSSRTPPVADLLEAGYLTAVSNDTELTAELIRLLAQSGAARARQRRDLQAAFLNEFSITVNRARLSTAVDSAFSHRQAFGGGWAGLCESLFRASACPRPAWLPQTPPQHPPGAVDAAGLPLYDLVFFWKQNDSGLYGRRSDMLVKYLARSGRIRRLIHFDAPISVQALSALEEQALLYPLDQAGHIARNVARRARQPDDGGVVVERVFLHSSPGQAKFDGANLPGPSDQAEFVARCLREQGVDPAQAIAWVCPVVWDFPMLRETLGFRRVVADIIDDQRAWEVKPKYLERLQANYADVLRHADLVLTNCQPNVDGFSALAGDIHVVPNGAEPFELPEGGGGPEAGQAPVVGYVGNLRDRIDWPLVFSLVEARPDYRFVFLGSTRNVEQANALERFPNVELRGTVPYDEARQMMLGFSVAIMPHLANQLTETMNPLKLYNYVASGVPTVSTPVGNIGELSRFIHVAADSASFLSAIDECIAAGRPARPVSALAAFSWQHRAQEVLRLMDERFAPVAPGGHA